MGSIDELSGNYVLTCNFNVSLNCNVIGLVTYPKPVHFLFIYSQTTITLACFQPNVMFQCLKFTEYSDVLAYLELLEHGSTVAECIHQINNKKRNLVVL